MKKIIWITTPDGNAYIDAEEILAVVETYKPFKSPPSTTTGESEVRAVRSHVFLKGAESYFVAIEDPEVILQRMDIEDPADVPQVQEE
jgi:hypothetical protein